jgi:hypothetical protein
VLRGGLAGDARRAQVALSKACQRLYDELFPQIAALNSQVVNVLDDKAVKPLDRALHLLTAQATQLNTQVLRDLRANRQAGSRKRLRQWPLSRLSG